jgi:WD40 repeat protein
LEVWDRIEERKLCSLPDLFPGGSYDLGRSRILTYHTNVAGDRVLAAWQLPGGERVWEQEDGGGICYGVSCTPNGDYVLITQEWSMEVFRVDDYGAHRTLELPKGIFVRAVLSPDGRSFATGTADITLRNVATGEVEGVLRGHTRKNTRFAFSPDGRTLASMADDRTIRLWHLPTRREMLRFGMGNEIQGGLGLEFSPDGRVLAAYWEDDQGPVTRLFFAPSFAEIAVAEGADPSPIAGRDPVAWMAVAGELRRLGRLDDARAAYARALDLVRGDPAKVWLHSRIREMEATLQVSM